MAAILASLLLAAGSAQAQCGGFCVYEVATPQMGSSYAGAGATADDAATAFLNPAGMTRLHGTNYLAGVVVSQVASGFDIDRAGTSATGGDGGELGGVFPFGGVYLAVEPPAGLALPEGLRVGFAFNNLYGGDLSYDTNWAGRTYITRTRFFGLNVEPSLAYRLTPWLSLGAAANVLYYRLIYNFRSTVAANSPTVKIHGPDDWTASFTLGALLEPLPDTRIGVVYRHDFDVALRGTARVTDSTRFGGLSANFASDFELPRGVNVSVLHELTPGWDILADAGWSDWSTFSGQTTSYRGGFNAQLAGFRHWHDTWRVAGGVRTRVSERLRVQAGVSYDSSPVPASNRLPDVPASETYRGSIGLAWDVRRDEDLTVTLGLTYTLLWAAHADVDRVVVATQPTVTTLSGTYRPDFANLIGVTFAARF